MLTMYQTEMVILHGKKVHASDATSHIYCTDIILTCYIIYCTVNCVYLQL